MGAAFLVALAVVIGAYLLSTADYAPKVDVSDITSTPNIYVSSIPPEHVISVSGTASQRVAPDLLNIQVSIETSADTAKQSQDDNSEVSEDVRNRLKDAGVQDDEIKTVSYSVDVIRNSTRKCDDYGCSYDWVIVGYKTTHVLNIRTTDLEDGGAIVDAASGAGENEVFVDYVSFSLQEETRREIQKDLLKEAGQEAEEKAQSIAEGLGATLGKVVQASESFYYPQPVYRSYDYVMAEAAAEPVPTSFSAGEVEVSATVSAGYELS